VFHVDYEGDPVVRGALVLAGGRNMWPPPPPPVVPSAAIKKEEKKVGACPSAYSLSQSAQCL
jgi:hypothetical protein